MSYTRHTRQFQGRQCKMAAEQKMTQAIMEAAKVVLMAVRGADNLVNSARNVKTMPRSGSPVLRQPIFDWKAADKTRNCVTLK